MSPSLPIFSNNDLTWVDMTSFSFCVLFEARSFFKTSGSGERVASFPARTKTVLFYTADFMKLALRLCSIFFVTINPQMINEIFSSKFWTWLFAIFLKFYLYSILKLLCEISNILESRNSMLLLCVNALTKCESACHFVVPIFILDRAQKRSLHQNRRCLFVVLTPRVRFLTMQSSENACENSYWGWHMSRILQWRGPLLSFPTECRQSLRKEDHCFNCS